MFNAYNCLFHSLTVRGLCKWLPGSQGVGKTCIPALTGMKKLAAGWKPPRPTGPQTLSPPHHAWVHLPFTSTPFKPHSHDGKEGAFSKSHDLEKGPSKPSWEQWHLLAFFLLEMKILSKMASWKSLLRAVQNASLASFFIRSAICSPSTWEYFPSLVEGRENPLACWGHGPPMVHPLHLQLSLLAPPEAGTENCKCNHIITGYLAIGRKCKQVAEHPKCNHVTGKRVAWSFMMPRGTLQAKKHPFHCCCDCECLLKEQS